jgi:hypothetical protein
MLGMVAVVECSEECCRQEEDAELGGRGQPGQVNLGFGDTLGPIMETPTQPGYLRNK